MNVYLVLEQDLCTYYDENGFRFDFEGRYQFISKTHVNGENVYVFLTYIDGPERSFVQDIGGRSGHTAAFIRWVKTEHSPAHFRGIATKS